MINPIIEAKSAIVVDVDTGAILYKKNAFERLPIASITKLMTAIITLENQENIYEFTKVPSTVNQIGGSSMHLVPYEQVKTVDLLKGLLLPSGNDAAFTLAQKVAGSTAKFVEMMNEKAKSLGLIDTSFANPMGFDDEDNFSTAYEVTLLAKESLKHDIIKKITSMPKATVFSRTGKFEHEMYNTNKLLNSYLDVRGLKTGRTDEAGASLSAYADHRGHEIISVVLNSPNRFQETKVLLDWVYQSYTWPEEDNK
jgi:D-alanyl-D-alanine carboxypeptidase